MITPGADLKIYMATRPVDFRRGLDGLAATVQEQLGLDPYSGAAFVFRAKRSQVTTFNIRFAVREDCLSLAPAVWADIAGRATPARQGSEVHLHG
jgi:IS66 Orf2 like protein